MRPFSAIRRVPGLAGVAVLAACVTGGVVAATSPPPPSAETSTGSTEASPGSSDVVDGDGIPGGAVPDVLTEGTWFDDEGRLYFPENTAQSAEKDAAFCSFVFGTPDEVADVLGLGDLAWATDSGLVNLGGGGTGYSCGLVPADSDDVLVTSPEPTADVDADTSPDSGVADAAAAGSSAGATVGTDTVTDHTESDAPVHPLVVFVLLSEPLEIDESPDGYSEVFLLDGADAVYYGALALSSEFDGTPIDAEFAEAWLTAARDRLA